MMGRIATRRTPFLATMLLAILSLAAVAQQEGKQQKPVQDQPKPLPYVVRVRLPNYFGQIGLSRRQRAELREVCEKFDRKIAELRWKIRQMQQEIRKLMQEKEAACTEKLTDEQRKRLEEVRAAAASRRGRRAARSDDQ